MDEAQVYLKDGILFNPNPGDEIPELKTSFVETIFDCIRKNIEKSGDRDVIINGALGILLTIHV